MKRIAPLLLLTASLSGCALGLGMGQRYVKADAKPGEYEVTVARCTEQMYALPPVYDTSFKAERLIPGTGLREISSDKANRDKFSQECMAAEGWKVE